MNKLSGKGLGFALGILHALCMLIVGLGVWLFGFWPSSADILSEWYVGFGPSFLGMVAGIVWGFVDGFVGGFLLAWLYNKFQK